jgi:hypothetical protein
MNARTHLNNDEFVSYIYNMLDDAQREVFNKHLTQCPVCRARLAEHERCQHRIENDLKAKINGNSSSPGVSFAQILPRLQRRHTLWQRFSDGVPLVAASLGLVLALIGVWQTLVGSYPFRIDPGRLFSTPLPALACFFFMFVSMDQYDRSISLRPKFIFAVILSLILWVGTSILGLLNIIVIRDLTIAAVIFTGGNPAGASIVAILSVILAAMVVIGVIIGGAEFHYKHLGQPSSWKLFVWTIAIQLLIMVLPYFLL